ncbi:hypothetical protein [Mycobacterium sp. AZCC_0083]|uniref:hypothetical protein n=1 Tax=Mycobacterium sp. AZCC_0083 TaxID=2735882 RepID=UPI001622221F|nr:hypothetical protein [Mycobacterium sp. AZCC_0083]MBB5167091.1 hypothetical protein [Mycobacterium sp. AZCC_0083]
MKRQELQAFGQAHGWKLDARQITDNYYRDNDKVVVFYSDGREFGAAQWFSPTGVISHHDPAPTAVSGWLELPRMAEA